MDGNYSLADIAAATGNGRNNDGMFVEMAAGGLLFYSFLLSSDGETTAGAIMATAVDMQPQQLLRQTFREDLITPQ